jgi:hypothetical protein
MRAYRFCYVKKYFVFLRQKCHYQVSSAASSSSGRQISARKLDIRTEFRYVPVLEMGTSIAKQMKLLISACFPIHYNLTNLLFNSVFFELLGESHCATRLKVAGSISDWVLDMSFTISFWPNYGSGVDSASNRNE